MAGTTIAALEKAAARRHALLTRQQCDEAGLTARQIKWLLTSERWRRVHYDVFAVAGAPATWQQTVMAAVLAAGRDAVASHTTAAVVWRAPNVGRERTEVTTNRPRNARIAGVRVHRTVAFLSEEHTVLGGIPVTTVARTLLDLSARLSVAQLGVITDDALRRGTMTLRELQRCVAGLPGAPGRRPSRIRAVLVQRLEGYEPGDSALELRVLRAIVAAGLPEPIQQHGVTVRSRRYRIDLAYPEHRLAIEVDGFEPHRHRSAFDRDRARANDLVVDGWTILRFTSESTDAEIAASVGAALAQLVRDRTA